MVERPKSGGDVALGDDDLAKIGLAVVYEAAAKTMAASALRSLDTLSEGKWKTRKASVQPAIAAAGEARFSRSRS